MRTSTCFPRGTQRMSKEKIGIWNDYWSRGAGEEGTIEYKLLKKWVEPSGICVLEPGCGAAMCSSQLAKEGAKVTCLDFSIEALKKARENFTDLGGNFILGDLSSLPFKENVFDLVWNEGVLEHFTNPNAPFSEMVRVAKNGGTVSIMAPNRLNPIYQCDVLKAKVAGKWQYGYERAFSAWSLKKLFARHDLLNIEVEGFNSVRRRIGILLKFFHKINCNIAEKLRWHYVSNNLGPYFGFIICCKGVKRQEHVGIHPSRKHMRMLAFFYHPIVKIGGAERRFLNVIKHWRRWGIGVVVVESEPPLIPSSLRISIPIKGSKPIKDIIHGLIFMVKSLAKAFSLKGYDAVLSPNNNIFSIFPSFILAKFRRKPCVAIVHHFDIIEENRLTTSACDIYRALKKQGPFHGLLKTIAMKVAMLLIKRCEITVCVSRAFTEVFPEAQLSSNAINLNYIRSVPSAEEKYDACYVGRVNVGKGGIDLLKIWRKVVEKAKNPKLVVVGQDQINFRDLISKYDLEDNVIYKGFLPDDEMYKAMKASKVFITASIAEGWGISIAEALACGIPVICYNIKTLRETWGACPHVTLCEVGDISGFADRVAEALELKNSPAEIRNYVKRYDWEEVARRDLDIIDHTAHKTIYVPSADCQR